jgi:hypothetical protein
MMTAAEARDGSKEKANTPTTVSRVFIDMIRL